MERDLRRVFECRIYESGEGFLPLEADHYWQAAEIFSESINVATGDLLDRTIEVVQLGSDHYYVYDVKCSIRVEYQAVKKRDI